MSLAQPRITIAGASGFLGRACVEACVEGSIPVRIISRRDVLPRNNVEAIRIAAYDEIPSPATADDVLIHLAQPSQVPTFPESSSAIAVVQRIARLGYRHLVYASSARVYGDRLAYPRRTDESVAATGSYEEMKLTCETIVCGAGGASVRLANLYGVGQPSATVMGRILSQIPGSGDLKLWSTSPVRDFCWVDDAADAMVTLARGTASGIFNVGTGIGTSIGTLTRLALQAANEEGRPVREEAPGGSPSVLILDIGETSRRTGWKPQIGLKTGLNRLVQGLRVPA